MTFGPADPERLNKLAEDIHKLTKDMPFLLRVYLRLQSRVIISKHYNVLRLLLYLGMKVITWYYLGKATVIQWLIWLIDRLTEFLQELLRRINSRQ